MLGGKYCRQLFIVIFVAVDWNKVPKVKPEETETLSLLDRDYRLERQMTHVFQHYKDTFVH